jgi:hypothetical protein
MGLMTLGAVLALGDGLPPPAIAQVGSDPVALVEDLHRSRHGADLHDLLHQCVRHTVKVPIEGDVVIDVDGGPRLLAHVEALGLATPHRLIAKIATTFPTGRAARLR